MTQHEYDQYVARVKQFFTDEGITNLSRKSDCDESYFSWRSCDCCGTHLGGDRIDADGYNPTTQEVQEYMICTDCEYFAEYGQLDDMTMLAIDSD